MTLGFGFTTALALTETQFHKYFSARHSTNIELPRLLELISSAGMLGLLRPLQGKVEEAQI